MGAERPFANAALNGSNPPKVAAASERPNSRAGGIATRCRKNATLTRPTTSAAARDPASSR